MITATKPLNKCAVDKNDPWLVLSREDGDVRVVESARTEPRAEHAAAILQGHSDLNSGGLPNQREYFVLSRDEVTVV